MSEQFTVCKECKYLLNTRDGPRTEIWYNNHCEAVINEKVRDPYDGKWKYGGKNDLGRIYTTDERHPNVRDINPDGNCMFFESKLITKIKKIIRKGKNV